MNAPTDNINDAGPDDAILEPLGSDGPDDVAPDADADELARSRGDAADEHAPSRSIETTHARTTAET